jgi:hypothetical protein
MDNAYDRVKAEWTIACRRTRISGLAAHWEATEPALAGIACLEDALARCHDQRHPASAHAAVAALLVLAQDDTVARLAVVRALLPGLAGLAHRGCHLGDRSSGRDPRPPTPDRLVVAFARPVGWPLRFRRRGCRPGLRAGPQAGGPAPGVAGQRSPVPGRPSAAAPGGGLPPPTRTRVTDTRRRRRPRGAGRRAPLGP